MRICSQKVGKEIQYRKEKIKNTRENTESPKPIQVLKPGCSLKSKMEKKLLKRITRRFPAGKTTSPLP
jgi:hypothetical protein